MKAVILSASTGGGHMSAANAVKEYLNENGVQATVIDAIEYISHILNKTITEIYEYVAIKSPLLWKIMYKSSNKKLINDLIAGTNGVVSKKLLPLLESYNPDVIITTHPFTTAMVSKLKSHKKICTPLMCIMTDYAPHRTWINSEVDAYIVANENMITPMIEMNVPASKIYPFGIPVDDAFFGKRNKEEIIKNMNLRADLPTILIMAGKGGMANIDKIYSKLQEVKTNFQIIIITGKNKKLYEKMQILSSSKTENIKKDFKHRILSKISDKAPKISNLKLINKITSKKIKPTKPTKVIYFTDEVEKYMWIADLIITKPGGLTISEALACNLPMALYDAIPGQEEENADFLVSNNMAIRLSQESNIAETIENLLSNPQKLNAMKYSCENFDKSDALQNILKTIRKIAL